MSVIVGLGQNQTINQSGADSVSFLGLGTLDITGTPAQPITVTLSQVAGIGVANTISLTDADVTLSGVAGVNALVDYTLGQGSTLRLASTVGVAAGSSVTFTAPDSELIVGRGVDLNALNSIGGFGPGNTIDVSALATSVSYADNAGTGTGGTLTLLNGSGQTVATLPLTSGEYVAGEFQLSPDGTGGTQVRLGVTTTGVTASPMTADLGTGRMIVLSVNTSAPVTVTGGTPTLALNDGGTATYDPTASSGGTLAFKYTVAAGQNTPDLAVVGASLNGATVAGSGGVPLDLTGALVNPAGTLQIDTTAPTVTGVSTNPGSGTVQPGNMVGITVGTSEGVTVSGGTPTLSLSDGGTATYDPTSSTPTMLMFMHTVEPGQSTADLTVTGVNPNGSSISDPAGNAADLSGAVTNPAGVLMVADGSTGSGTTGSGTAGSGTTGSGVPVNGTTVNGTTGPGTASAGLGVYRFFDSSTGTHFFTADVNEKNSLMSPSSAGYRPDLKEEVNNFGAADPSTAGSGVETVYRFFDTVHGTHFFTASQSEASSLMDPKSSTYRSDLTFEPSSSFLEHSTQQAGDVAVYRFFDQTYGTHFYTGSQSEYAAITTPGAAGYRADLVSEGVGFYAPSGSYV